MIKSPHLLECTYDVMINDLLLELMDASGIGDKATLVYIATDLKDQITMDPKNASNTKHHICENF